MKGITGSGGIDRFNVKCGCMVLAVFVLPIHAVRSPGRGDERGCAIKRCQSGAWIVFAAVVLGEFLGSDQIIDLVVQ